MSALADLIDTADILGHNAHYTMWGDRQEVMLTTRDHAVPVADQEITSQRLYGAHVVTQSYEGNEAHFITASTLDLLDPDALVEHAHQTLLDLAFAAVAW